MGAPTPVFALYIFLNTRIDHILALASYYSVKKKCKFNVLCAYHEIVPDLIVYDILRIKIEKETGRKSEYQQLCFCFSSFVKFYH